MSDLVDPDMPAQQLRLHMGEVTAQEMRTARAAIRWANSAAQARIEAVRRETVEALQPFADGVFNDNGDMTVTPVCDYDTYVRAYFVHKRAIRALTEAKEDRT